MPRDTLMEYDCDFLPLTLSDVVWHGFVPAKNLLLKYLFYAEVSSL